MTRTRRILLQVPPWRRLQPEPCQFCGQAANVYAYPGTAISSPGVVTLGGNEDPATRVVLCTDTGSCFEQAFAASGGMMTCMVRRLPWLVWFLQETRLGRWADGWLVAWEGRHEGWSPQPWWRRERP